jgi:RNA polymerase sigma-70 factor (ECF subfamily)
MARPVDAYVREILRLEELLRVFLHRFAPKPVDLEDLLQETYLRLLGLSTEQRAGVRSVQAFALTTARHVAVDWIRRRQVVGMDVVDNLDAVPVTGEEGGLEDLVSTHQQLMQIAEAVDSLPERCREVFTLRRVYGLSQKEIARQLRISDKTVEQHLVQGMRRCARFLADSPQSAATAVWVRRWLFKRTRKERHG